MQNSTPGTFLPLDTLDLVSSISAVPENLVLNCKRCGSGGGRKDHHNVYSGTIGVICKDHFIIYHFILDPDSRISYELVHAVEPKRHSKYGSLKPSFFTAKWVRLQNRTDEKRSTVLVLASNSGINTFSEDGKELLGTYEYDEVIPETMCRSVCAKGRQILAANGRGEVHMLEFDGDNDSIQFKRTIKIQREAISQMCVGRRVLITGSPSGDIRVWKLLQGKATKVCCFKTPMEECTTGLKVWGPCVVASYGSGTFRIFHLSTRKLLARVMGHARWIGNIDILTTPKKLGLLLTVAEDDVVLTWKIRNVEQGPGKTAAGIGRSKRKCSKITVELDASIPVDNMLLVGGKFITCSGNVIALVNYAAKEIYFYRRLDDHLISIRDEEEEGNKDEEENNDDA